MYSEWVFLGLSLHDFLLISVTCCKNFNILNINSQFIFYKVIRSVMIIQKWYRLYKSRIELRMLTAWNIYQTLEYKGEQDQLKLNDFFLALIQNHELINPKKKSIQKSSTLDSTDASLIDDKDSSKSHFV
jgi:hypothetical protein